jgi:hypothetical protein
METELTKAQRADLKRFVLKSELDRDLRHINLNIYTAVKEQDEVKYRMAQDDLNNFKEQCGEPLFKSVESINNSRYHRIKKVKEKINEVVITGHAVFITLTFTNEILSSTSEITRRRYVARFLKDTCDFFVANQDFGEDFGREHYHAVVSPKNDNLDLSKWVYGFSSQEKVRCTSDDVGAISRYVTKLTYHAVKNSASTNRLIYSRNNSDFRKKVKAELNRKELAAFVAEWKEAQKTGEELIKEIF